MAKRRMIVQIIPSVILALPSTISAGDKARGRGDPEEFQAGILPGRHGGGQGVPGLGDPTTAGCQDCGIPQSGNPAGTAGSGSDGSLDGSWIYGVSAHKVSELRGPDIMECWNYGVLELWDCRTVGSWN